MACPAAVLRPGVDAVHVDIGVVRVSLDFRKVTLLAGERDHRLAFMLIGASGAVQLVGMVITNPEVIKIMSSDVWGTIPIDGGILVPMDLGYHSPAPMYEGHEQLSATCEWLPGGVCYYDGSSLNAQRPFDAWRESGYDDTVIEHVLTNYYRGTFDEHNDPDV